MRQQLNCRISDEFASGLQKMKDFLRQITGIDYGSFEILQVGLRMLEQKYLARDARHGKAELESTFQRTTRGRPPEDKVEKIAAEELPAYFAAKRGRGRPAEKTAEVLPAKVKRGRGRPKKKTSE